MQITPHSFLDAVAKRWDEVMASLSGHGINSRNVVDTDRGTMGIEIESQAHVALIQVWERAQSLDVTLLVKSSRLSTILSAGPCLGEADVEGRLHALRDALLRKDAK